MTTPRGFWFPLVAVVLVALCLGYCGINRSASARQQCEARGGQVRRVVGGYTCVVREAK